MTRAWQTVLGITVSLLLLYWALHDVSAAEFWRHLNDANLKLLTLAVAVQTGGFVIRAARWQVFLAPALPRSSFRARFGSTCIGFMANNVLPARVGEFARAYALSRSAPIGAGAAFGSLVVERLFDAFTLAVFLAVPILLPGFLDVPGLGERLAAGLVAILIVFAVAVSGLLILIWWPEPATRIFSGTVGRLLPGRAAEAIARVMESFIVGLGAMRRPSLVAAGLAWSFFHWLWGALAYYLGLIAFGITQPGYLGAVFLQAVNAFAVAIPSSPGFFGPFEASVRLALSPFGIAPAEAVSFAAAFHIGTFIPVTVLGIYYLGRLGLSWGDVEHSEEIVEEGDLDASDGRVGGAGAGAGAGAA